MISSRAHVQRIQEKLDTVKDVNRILHRTIHDRNQRIADLSRMNDALIEMIQALREDLDHERHEHDLLLRP